MWRESGGWIWSLVGLGLVIGGIAFFITSGIVPIFQAHSAESWTATTCAIFDVEITRRVDSDGDVRFDRRLQYSFEHAGRTYQGDRLDFTGTTSSSNETMLRAGVPKPGTRAPCWFDPADPARSVLRREGFALDHTLIPLVVVAAGAALIGLGNPRTTRRRTRPDGRTELARRNASGPVVLLLAALAGTFLPAGFVIAANDPWPGFAYVVVGVGLAAVFGYFLLGYLTEVTIQHAGLALRPGDPLELTWQVRTPFREIDPLVTLIGNEVCEWSEGSSAQIELHEFHRRFVKADARVPDDAMPTLDLGGNRIDWMLHLVADIPWWPDLALDIPLVIHGARSETRAAPAPLPILNQRPIVLDTDALVPGAPITGAIQWRCDEVPKRARIALSWTTESAKSTFTEVVRELDVADLPTLIDDPSAAPYRSSVLQEGTAEPLDSAGRRRLHLIAPDAPYTFAGKLFKVKWRLELAIEDHDGFIDRRSVALTISATVPRHTSPPEVSVPPSAKKKKKKTRGFKRRRR